MTNADSHIDGGQPTFIDEGANWCPAPIRALAVRLGTQTALIVADLAGYLIAFALLYELDYFGAEAGLVSRLCLLLGPITVLLYAFAGLYPPYLMHQYEQMRRRLLAAGTVGLVAGLTITSSAANPETVAAITGFLAAALVLQFVLQPLARAFLHRTGFWGVPAAIQAEGDKAAMVRGWFLRNWHYGIIPAGPDADPQLVIVAVDGGPSPTELESLQRRYARVLLLANMPDIRIAGLQPVAIGGRIGLSIGEIPPAAPSNRLRRAFDLAIALPAAITFTPLMAFAAAGIWIVDPGPVIYRQPREGLRGRTVNVLKLRTMYQDAEARLKALLESDPAARDEWSRHFKLRDDPRILPGIGPFLRSSSLDELPQLFNVIGGSMCVVGPRPFPDYHLSAMDKAFRVKRASVTPGMTGLWQISDRSDADLDQQQQLDEFYIENRSFWFDWYIVISTVSAVFRRSGA